MLGYLIDYACTVIIATLFIELKNNPLTWRVRDKLLLPSFSTGDEVEQQRVATDTGELKFERDSRKYIHIYIFDDFTMKRFATRGGREFKSGSYFRSHRGDNAISAFTRNDLSERVRQRAFRPDVSVVVEPSSPFFLIDFLLPLSLFSDITLRLNGTGETVLLSLLSSNRIIRKMAETIAKYSRLITDRRRRQKRREKKEETIRFMEIT